MSDPTAQLTDPTAIRNFLLGGHALFTLVSKRTGERRTFEVEQAPKSDRHPRPGYFVRYLFGPDNTNDYRYLGFLFQRDDGSLGVKVGHKSTIERGTPTSAAFVWFVDVLTRAPEKLAQVEFWHAGRCCRCGRTLTTPESIASGIGPVCASRE